MKISKKNIIILKYRDLEKEKNACTKTFKLYILFNALHRWKNSQSDFRNVHFEVSQFNARTIKERIYFRSSTGSTHLNKIHMYKM